MIFRNLQRQNIYASCFILSEMTNAKKTHKLSTEQDFLFKKFFLYYMFWVSRIPIKIKVVSHSDLLSCIPANIADRGIWRATACVTSIIRRNDVRQLWHDFDSVLVLPVRHRYTFIHAPEPQRFRRVSKAIRYRFDIYLMPTQGRFNKMAQRVLDVYITSIRCWQITKRLWQFK